MSHSVAPRSPPSLRVTGRRAEPVSCTAVDADVTAGGAAGADDQRDLELLAGAEQQAQIACDGLGGEFGGAGAEGGGAGFGGAGVVCRHDAGPPYGVPPASRSSCSPRCCSHRRDPQSYHPTPPGSPGTLRRLRRLPQRGAGPTR
ncbi:hypothetical protein AMK27_06200 [Streptomyces sp. CB02009]|nr:hypothetical protein AMK27_06200 [Streptomyces sp. CB02009]